MEAHKKVQKTKQIINPSYATAATFAFCLLLFLGLGGCSLGPKKVFVEKAEVDSLVKARVESYVNSKKLIVTTSGDSKVMIFTIENGIISSLLIVGSIGFVSWVKLRRSLRSCVKAIESSGLGSTLKKCVKTQSRFSKVEKFLDSYVQKWTLREEDS